jgi:hypothetical protein
MRFSPFTNIDGEAFAKPTLNGFWKVNMSMIGLSQQAQLALSAFHTQMKPANARCVIPVISQWRPNDDNGRMLAQNHAAPEWTFDHIGWANDPFDGFTLRAAASHRDSYIDVNKPALSQLWPGHYITIGNRLHQVVNVSSIDESETAIRVSVMPNIRGAHPIGTVVVVDQLVLEVNCAESDPIVNEGARMNPIGFSFIEAF